MSWKPIAVFLDAPDRIIVEGSSRMESVPFRTEDILLTDDQDQQISIASLALDVASSYSIVVMPSIPIDPTKSYQFGVAGLEGTMAIMPRGVLNDASIFGNPDALMGAEYSRGGTMFRLFAPTANVVELILYESAEADLPVARHSLLRATAGLWEIKVSGDLRGLFYTFRLNGPDMEGDREVLDIYAINAVGGRGRITALGETNPPGWEQAQHGPSVASPVDMVIYEMHVRDFTIDPNSGVSQKGLYLGFTETGACLHTEPEKQTEIKTGLDHLTELGITHVQLMPVQHFGGPGRDGNSWGYMTIAFNSPEGWYATNPNDDSRIRELKTLIKALHERGIGVIMDVIYNHTADTASFDRIVPGYYHRYWPDGSRSNGSGVGNEFCSERPMARKFILDSLKYWVVEYGVDGFRFDMMSLTDLETMREIEQALRRIRPDIVLYGEPWKGSGEPFSMTGLPTSKENLRAAEIAAFNDDFRDALKGFPRGEGKGFIQDGSWCDNVVSGLKGSWRSWPLDPFRSINYMSCHDDLVLYDKLKLSMPNATYEQIKEAMKIGYLLLLTAQGIPFIHCGEEFMRTKNGDDNSYKSGDTINQVDWSLKQTNYDLFSHARKLIAIRKEHPVFRLRSASQVVDRLSFMRTPDSVIGYLLDGAGLSGETWDRVCVLVNPSGIREVELPAGLWRIGYCSNNALLRRTNIIKGRLRLSDKSGMILYQEE
ncbi:MAG: type I pullulanase [Nitrospirales bacterium]|nr:type I pullulanase [Nitrospirales bacterium]